MKEMLKDEALQAQAAEALKSMQKAAAEVKKTQQQIKSYKKAEKKLNKAEKKKAKKAAAVKGEVVATAAKPSEPKAAPAKAAPKVEAKAKAKATPKKDRHPVRTLLIVGTIGAVVALVVSEDARKAVLDLLFGAEEEFEYTSNASAATSSTNGAS